MAKISKRILLTVLCIVGACVLAFAVLLAYLSITEYDPPATEALELTGSASKTLAPGDALSVLTWNIGYGSLDKDHDFFMDGGKDVNTESANNIMNNMDGILAMVQSQNADVMFLQEVDKNSKRSFGIDEAAQLDNLFSDDTAAFATNFLCDYIPYPLPTIGRVNGGLLTLNRLNADSAERIALPTAYKWPIRICQLKRCLLVERVPLDGTDKELVLVNLHLEAYDDGTGRLAQTQLMLDFLREEYEKGNYCIAGGDFNQTFGNIDPSLYTVKQSDYFMPGIIEQSALPENWQLANDSTVPTCRLLCEPYNPDTAQLYVIDGFIVSPNVTIRDVQTIDAGFAHSDHNPVLLQAVLTA